MHKLNIIDKYSQPLFMVSGTKAVRYEPFLVTYPNILVRGDTNQNIRGTKLFF
jgi:hypothetical protein